MAEDKIERPVPDVLAMVLSDGILRDVLSGKHYIQGTYSAIIAPEFPWRHGPVAVYVAITRVRGKIPLKLRLVDVDEEHDPLFEITLELDSPDPLLVGEAIFGHPAVVFPAPGEYRLQLFGGVTICGNGDCTSFL